MLNCQWLEISHGGNSYAVDIGNCYQLGHLFRELISQYTTAWVPSNLSLWSEWTPFNSFLSLLISKQNLLGRVSHLLHFSLPGTWLPFILPSCHSHLSVSPTGHDLPFHRASEQAAPSARKYLPTFSAWLTSINPSGLCWSATSWESPR